MDSRHSSTHHAGHADPIDDAIDGAFRVVSESLATADEDDGLAPSAVDSLDPNDDLDLDPNDDGLGSPRYSVVESTPSHNRIILPSDVTLPDAIHLISKDIPNNEYGLPTFYYRSDLLPADLESLTGDDLDAASVRLDYSEGYPTFGESRPWWTQLPHEPMAAYGAFRRFIAQAEELGIRQLALLATDEGLDLSRVSEWSKLYYWSKRAHIHDLFIVAADKKRTEHRQRSAVDKHYLMASKLLEELQSKFENPEWIAGLDAKEAIDALEKLVKIQRVAMGLPSNGNADFDKSNPNEGLTVSAVMKELTKAGAQAEGGEGMSEDMRRLMQGDPQFIARAQSLVIQVRRGTDGSEIAKGSADKLIGDL